MYEASSFVTLTYDDPHYAPSLNYHDFQCFMYKLRKRFGPTRFFVSGEYGGNTGRPHFHAIIFGRTFMDGLPCGSEIRTSPILSELWKNGFISVGKVTYQSAAYVAGYCLKKMNGNKKIHTVVDLRTGEFVDRVDEFGHMSLRPGIGYSWFEKYWKEIYLARDGCVLKGGQQIPAPRYYDKLIERLNPDLWDEKSVERYRNASNFFADSSPARLAVRETCAKARYKMKQRIL